MGLFGLGQPVRRSEDARLLTGRGRYVADVAPPGALTLLFLRSPHGHAEIGAIDVTAARAISGVRAVFTAADVAADGLGDLPCIVSVRDRQGQPLPRHGRPLLARDRVRHVGEAVAMVIAETPAAARDALDAIRVDYRPLPAAASMAEALADGAPVVHADRPDNRAFYWQMGDAEATARALAEAARVITLRLVQNRVVPCAMEPRAVVAEYDSAADRYTLTTSSQGAHGVREMLASATLKVPEERIRVVIGDVGGGFGTKLFHYAEEALALWAARRLGQTVKWVGDRSEAFLADTHGRDQANAIRAGFDQAGRLIALEVKSHANMGAYLNAFAPMVASRMTGCMLAGAYAVPLIFASCEGVYTHTTPVDAYRGAGRPEATYIIERVMDAAAREFGLAPEEIRWRNFIRPDQMPFRTASGCTYDSGDFARNLDDALIAADVAGFPARQADAAARGRRRGIGLSTYVEICGFEEEEATLRVHDDGAVELLIGTQSSGQGHETAYAQIIAGELGVPFERIRVVQGDTDRIPFGRGTGGSRSLPVGGPAVSAACAALIEKGKALARQLLQAGEADIEFADGHFRVAGRSGGPTLSIEALAKAARAAETGSPAGLDATARYTSRAPTFPNGCHIAEVEVDPETGHVAVVRYTVVDDFGTIVNPLLLAGQIHGGVVQGIGQALMEHAVYEAETAQLQTGSFVDYALPRAGDVPSFAVAFNVVPCQTNPLGIKGAGEAGTIAACPAVINAVLDALAPLGVSHVDMPATPETVWRAIRAATRPSA